jgi:DNA invertase Pin-like site-specific DNA recombinase
MPLRFGLVILGMKEKFVIYLRVSTEKQGIRGLGMQAQRDAVEAFLNRCQGEKIAEFAEVESGKRKDRPELEKAIALCRKRKAKLLIAKLDRLSRCASFVLNLRDSGLDFAACDLPADRFTIGLFALLAEKEREMISERTRAGLAAAKRRGAKLGNPNPVKALKVAWRARGEASQRFAASLRAVVKEIQGTGMTSLRQIAECLNRRGYRTPTGKDFAPQSVSNLLKRIAR